MVPSNYRNNLLVRELSEDTITETLMLIKSFEDFLQNYNKTAKDASIKEFHLYCNFLEKTGRLTYFNLLETLRYLIFVENEKLTLDLLDIIDGADLMQVLSDKIVEALGEEKRNEIFTGIEVPKILLINKDKPNIVSKVMDRMDSLIEKQTCQKIMGSGLHKLQKDGLIRLRKKFLEEKDLDAFLETQRNDFLNRMEQLVKGNSLFFNQIVDNQVFEYIKNNPAIESGIREGNKIIISKIPYKTKLYLNEEDKRLKGYYYCHCPWVREALRKGDIHISPTFCHCSAGWYKQKWDAIFDQPVKVDLIDTIFDGAMQCTFVVHIPEKFLSTLND